LPTPNRTGHTFNGWYTASSGGTRIGGGGASYTPSASTPLYAQWTALDPYIVTYNANGGSVSPASSTVTVGSSTTLPTPSRTGYNFGGWYTALSDGTRVGGAGSSYTPTANTSLYAQWTYPLPYTATIRESPSSITAAWGETVSITYTVTVPAIEGYDRVVFWAGLYTPGAPLWVNEYSRYIPTAETSTFTLTFPKSFFEEGGVGVGRHSIKGALFYPDNFAIYGSFANGKEVFVTFS